MPAEVLAADFLGVDYRWEIEHWGTKWDLAEYAAMDELPDGGSGLHVRDGRVPA